MRRRNHSLSELLQGFTTYYPPQGRGGPTTIPWASRARTDAVETKRQFMWPPALYRAIRDDDRAAIAAFLRSDDEFGPDERELVAEWVEGVYKRKRGREVDWGRKVQLRKAEQRVRVLHRRRQRTGQKTTLAAVVDEVAPQEGLDPQQLAEFVRRSARKK